MAVLLHAAEARDGTPAGATERRHVAHAGRRITTLTRNGVSGCSASRPTSGARLCTRPPMHGQTAGRRRTPGRTGGERRNGSIPIPAAMTVNLPFRIVADCPAALQVGAAIAAVPANAISASPCRARSRAGLTASAGAGRVPGPPNLVIKGFAWPLYPKPGANGRAPVEGNHMFPRTRRPSLLVAV